LANHPHKQHTPKTPWRWRGALLKLAAVVVVGYFVAGAARDAWGDLRRDGVTFRIDLAIASGLAFLAAGLPMAWFWRRTLVALGQPVPLGPVFAAYYVSQIAKYVPGKGAVIVLRLARMRPWGGCLRTQAASVFYETLTLMAVGGVLAAALVAAGYGLGGGATDDQARLLAALPLVLGLCCATPTLPPLARWLIDRLTPREASQDAIATPTEPLATINETRVALAKGLTWRLMAEGWVAATITWTGCGASLWLAAWSVGASGPAGWRLGPLWVLAASLPVVAGFLAMLPGGLLVREALGLKVLTPALGPGPALAATLAARLVWLAAEGLVCVMMIGAAALRPNTKQPPKQGP
jgi:hypothetical protein